MANQNQEKLQPPALSPEIHNEISLRYTSPIKFVVQEGSVPLNNYPIAQTIAKINQTTDLKSIQKLLITLTMSLTATGCFEEVAYQLIPKSKSEININIHALPKRDKMRFGFDYYKRNTLKLERIQRNLRNNFEVYTAGIKYKIGNYISSKYFKFELPLQKKSKFNFHISNNTKDIDQNTNQQSIKTKFEYQSLFQRTNKLRFAIKTRNNQKNNKLYQLDDLIKSDLFSLKFYAKHYNPQYNFITKFRNTVAMDLQRKSIFNKLKMSFFGEKSINDYSYIMWSLKTGAMFGKNIFNNDLFNHKGFDRSQIFLKTKMILAVSDNPYLFELNMHPYCFLQTFHSSKSYKPWTLKNELEFGIGVSMARSKLQYSLFELSKQGMKPTSKISFVYEDR